MDVDVGHDEREEDDTEIEDILDETADQHAQGELTASNGPWTPPTLNSAA